MPRDAQDVQGVKLQPNSRSNFAQFLSFGLRDLLRDLQMTKPKFNKSATSAAKMI
jgi:hypothetical protein